MDTQLIQNLGKHLSLTDIPESGEVEDYILTEEEEKMVINNSIDSVRDHKIWKWKQQLCFGEEDINTKLSSINWENEIDRSKILKQANSNKHRLIWDKEQRLKEKIKEEENFKKLLDKCNSKYSFNVMLWTAKNIYGKELVVHEENKPLIKALCLLLSNDERYEKELNFSFKKGLLIRGVSGLGKTFLVKCLERHELNPILVLSTIEINEEIKEEGEFIIELRNNKIIYLDDIGTEEATVNHYGSKISFFKNFIEKIYLRNKSFGKIIASTNMNFKQIGEKYGFRVESRMREMFNVIDISGKDMRTNQS